MKEEKKTDICVRQRSKVGEQENKGSEEKGRKKGEKNENEKEKIKSSFTHCLFFTF